MSSIAGPGNVTHYEHQRRNCGPVCHDARQPTGRAAPKVHLDYLDSLRALAAIAAVLIPLLGLSGAALALLVIDVSMSAYVVTRSLELVEDTLPAFAKFVLTPPCLTLPRGPLAEAV